MEAACYWHGLHPPEDEKADNPLNAKPPFLFPEGDAKEISREESVFKKPIDLTTLEGRKKRIYHLLKRYQNTL